VGIAFFAMIAVCGVGPAIAREWRKAHQARSETALKQAMVERGMSADDIIRVLQAGHAEEEASPSATGPARMKEATDFKG